MRSSKTFLIAVLGALQPILLKPVSALTLDYATNSYALAGACWYDPFLGFICLGDSDHDENSNGPSYASAFYEIQYGGKTNISGQADASTEPNGVILSTELAGSYELDAGWVLPEAFYQDANSTTEGLLQITEFPPGTPCSLDINVIFPKASWTGFWAWQLYIESSLS